MTSNYTEEKELVEDLKKGDEDAYRFFMRRFKDTVYGIIHSYAGSNRFADDIAQEVFIVVFRKIHKFRGKSSLATWLYRVTVNKCRDSFRKNKMTTEELNPEHFAATNDDNPVDKILVRNTVHKMLASLPGKYRMPLILRELEGFSYNEIAGILKTSVGRVKILIFRAKEKIRMHNKNELQ